MNKMILILILASISLFSTELKKNNNDKLKVTEYIIDIVSNSLDVANEKFYAINVRVNIYDKNNNKIDSKLTPFKLKVSIKEPKIIEFHEDGYRKYRRLVLHNSPKEIIIKTDRLNDYKLIINNKTGAQASILGEDIDIKLIKKGKNRFRFYEGTYNIFFNKKEYKRYDKKITLNRNMDLDIDLTGVHMIPRERYLELNGSMEFISEYAYSNLLGNIFNIGVGFTILKDIKNYDYSHKKEFSYLSLGISGDFYSKSVSISLSVVSAKYYLSKNIPIFFQFGIWGIGDDIKFFYKDKTWYLRDYLSFKLGSNFEIKYPRIDMKLYLKLGLETEIRDDSIFKENGIYLGLGLSFEFNANEYRNYSGIHSIPWSLIIK